MRGLFILNIYNLNVSLHRVYKKTQPPKIFTLFQAQEILDPWEFKIASTRTPA